MAFFLNLILTIVKLEKFNLVFLRNYNLFLK